MSAEGSGRQGVLWRVAELRQQGGPRAVGGSGMLALGNVPQLGDRWPSNARSQGRF